MGMPEIPVTLENIGLKTWQDLFDLEPTETVRRMSEKYVPLHAGDAFLAVLLVRAISDLGRATDRLEASSRRMEASSGRLETGTSWLIRLTWALAALAVVSVVVAIIALART
jgi:hypothetical protein